MFNIPWSLFEKTGNVETYLLMKQLESNQSNQKALTSSQSASTVKPNVKR
ncbi:YqzL family protein [Alkalibacillus sp. S2W]